MTTKTLVVPVDETELSERAVPVAGALAAALGAEVVLVSVDAPHEDPVASEAYLRSLHERVPTSTRVTDHLVSEHTGGVGAVLVREAYENPAPAVVMATHARTGLGELVFGSTADTVVRSAPGPVVLVGPRCSTAWSPGTLVAAVDGSEVTDEVLDVAAGWATATGSDVVVAHVVVPVAIEGGAVVTGSRDLAETCAVRLRDAGIGATSATLEAASPSDAVLRCAADHGASLVVVGSERAGRIVRALLGSVSMGIVRRSTCPVVVVGSGPPGEDLRPW